MVRRTRGSTVRVRYFVWHLPDSAPEYKTLTDAVEAMQRFEDAEKLAQRLERRIAQREAQGLAPLAEEKG